VEVFGDLMVVVEVSMKSFAIAIQVAQPRQLIRHVMKGRRRETSPSGGKVRSRCVANAAKRASPDPSTPRRRSGGHDGGLAVRCEIKAAGPHSFATGYPPAAETSTMKAPSDFRPQSW
jgi:hypothetical protein